ncbi:MAG: EamA family transporter [Acidobacteriota bacterium]
MSNSIKRPGDPLGEADSHTGLGYGLAAFIFWGFAPIYFKTVAHVSPIEMLAHRILFGALVLLIWLGRAGKLGDLRACLSDRATLGRLSLTTLLIGYNWFLYTYALMRDQVLQVSLGYYIYPLVNVCLGFVVLGERLRRVQWLAVGLATVGVFYLTFAHGGLPVLSLLLAGSFAVYGLVEDPGRDLRHPCRTRRLDERLPGPSQLVHHHVELARQDPDLVVALQVELHAAGLLAPDRDGVS